ncbi:MAG: hypothetical protein WKG32_17830 [Gemmatimonadaceae bacterium]
MGRGIYLIHPDNQLTELREEPYEYERLLQQLLADHPGVLAGDGSDATHPRRWLLVTREAAVPDALDGAGRWSVDHLFLDQDAVPTLVEVKRSSDTRIRREVVGQMLDYAANAVVYWPPHRIRSTFEARCEARRVDPVQELARVLADGEGPDEFWQQVKTNLQAGRVRLVFVADVIPPELARIVEFLNQQMDPAEVIAIEVRQYVGGGLRTLVPSVIGQTAEAQQRKGVSASGRQWDEASFTEHLRRTGAPAAVDAAGRILRWAQSRNLRIWWGKGQRAGSFVPVFEHGGVGHQLFAVWSSGTIEIYFQWYATKPPFSDEGRRRELLERLNSIPGADINIPLDALRKRPNVPLVAFAADGACDQLLAIFDWFISEVRTTER